MAFDFKKEYKEFYLPQNKPEIVDIPPMNYIAISGKGDPTEKDGKYQQALRLLYGIAFTIKTSNKGRYKIEDFFEYHMPPLEVFWWMSQITDIDYSRKNDMFWISIMRIPEFVKKADFDWAIAQATRKKKKDFSKVFFFQHTEGLCIQCMHRGPLESETDTIRKMETYADENGYAIDISSGRLHHEIYHKDPFKSAPQRLRTVIRQPIRPKRIV